MAVIRPQSSHNACNRTKAIMSRFLPTANPAGLFVFLAVLSSYPRAADSTGVFCVHGAIAVGCRPSHGIPDARVRFYLSTDTTRAAYETRPDSMGMFRICPFDSGTYRVVFDAAVEDRLRRLVYRYYGICVPTRVSNVLPRISLSRSNSGFSYGMINELSPDHPPDTTSCRDEFRKEKEYRVHK
jgi:hypothetical protein